MGLQHFAEHCHEQLVQGAHGGIVQPALQVEGAEEFQLLGLKILPFQPPHVRSVRGHGPGEEYGGPLAP